MKLQTKPIVTLLLEVWWKLPIDKDDNVEAIVLRMWPEENLQWLPHGCCEVNRYPDWPEEHFLLPRHLYMLVGLVPASDEITHKT